MKKSYLSLFVICSFFLASCASIVSRSKYPVRINSKPEGAQVTIKGERGMPYHKAKTPTLITLDAHSGFFQSASYTAHFRRKGMTTTHPITATLDPWYIGNIVFGGLIGWLIVDPATGAMWKLDENVQVYLESPQSEQRPSTERRRPKTRGYPKN